MLRSHKKLTKKELKQDRLVLFTAQAVDYISREWPKIVGTIAGVAVIVGIGLFIVKSRERSELHAYDTAVDALWSNAPETPDLLQRFVSKYGGSDYAPQALLELADYNFVRKNNDVAKENYQKYLDKYGKDMLFSFHAYNGLGAVCEQQEDFVTAAKAYESFIKRFSDSPFVNYMHLNAGKAYYHSGDYTAAQTHFQAIIDDQKDTANAPEASFFLELIGKNKSGA